MIESAVRLAERIADTDMALIFIGIVLLLIGISRYERKAFSDHHYEGEKYP